MDLRSRNELTLRLGLLKREIRDIEDRLGLQKDPAGVPRPVLPEGVSETFFQLINEFSADMISVHAANGDYVWVSSNCQTLFGWRPEELVGRSAYELFDPEDITRIAEDHARHVRGELGAVRYRLKCVDGSFCWVETRSRSSPDGTYIVAITRDVQGEQEILEELGRRAFQDLVTTLPNRFALEEALDRELARAERESAPLSVLALDLDRFKKINDAQGHEAGDRFLYEVARKISSVLRGYDVAGRWGGDEFLLLLPGVTDETALLVGERVRSAIEEIGEDSSVSIGVSSTLSASSRRELLAQADKALYDAKALGGNKVMRWSPSILPPLPTVNQTTETAT
jgi:diguanylate cyclase (GGDEF)-like protein/PAS domain S-box-containing protein